MYYCVTKRLDHILVDFRLLVGVGWRKQEHIKRMTRGRTCISTVVPQEPIRDNASFGC